MMPDPNWKQMIVDIHGDVREMKPTVESTKKMVEGHETRIETLEQNKAHLNGYREAKEKFYKKHPVKTGLTIGGVSVATLFGIAVAAIKFIF